MKTPTPQYFYSKQKFHYSEVLFENWSATDEQTDLFSSRWLAMLPKFAPQRCIKFTAKLYFNFVHSDVTYQYMYIYRTAYLDRKGMLSNTNLIPGHNFSQWTWIRQHNSKICYIKKSEIRQYTKLYVQWKQCPAPFSVMLSICKTKVGIWSV